MKDTHWQHLHLVPDTPQTSKPSKSRDDLIGRDPCHLDHDQYPRIRALNLCICGEAKLCGTLRCPECALQSNIDHALMRDWERSLGGMAKIKMAKRKIAAGR